MITKVVLGVALVLIEFSASTVSQNNSLSSSLNDTATTVELPSIPADDVTTTRSYETTSAEADFRLPENCSAYKVGFIFRASARPRGKKFCQVGHVARKGGEGRWTMCFHSSSLKLIKLYPFRLNLPALRSRWFTQCCFLIYFVRGEFVRWQRRIFLWTRALSFPWHLSYFIHKSGVLWTDNRKSSICLSGGVRSGAR